MPVFFPVEVADEEGPDRAEEDFELGVGLGGCELGGEEEVYGGRGEDCVVTVGGEKTAEEKQIVAHARVQPLPAETARYAGRDERLSERT